MKRYLVIAVVALVTVAAANRIDPVRRLIQG